MFSPAVGPGHALLAVLWAVSPSYLARSLPCASCGQGPPIRSCSPLPGQMHALSMPFLTPLCREEGKEPAYHTLLSLLG